MNEMNDLERQLRSWAPRRPSVELEARIFRPQPATAPALRPAWRWPTVRLHWFAPATAALLLMGLVLNQHNNPAISGSGSSAAMVAMILSNQSSPAYLPGTFCHEQNRLPAETLEWTNGSRATPSVLYLSSPKGSH